MFVVILIPHLRVRKDSNNFSDNHLSAENIRIIANSAASRQPRSGYGERKMRLVRVARAAASPRGGPQLVLHSFAVSAGCCPNTPMSFHNFPKGKLIGIPTDKTPVWDAIPHLRSVHDIIKTGVTPASSANRTL